MALMDYQVLNMTVLCVTGSRTLQDKDVFIAIVSFLRFFSHSFEYVMGAYTTQ